jgi:CheY-like chemotaxis protein
MIDIKKMSVAIVDDIESMCKSIRGMLKVLDFGGNFFYGYNGRDALDIVRENEIDLLIMDWNMPVMSGIEALGHIRDDDRLRELPVVMITAEANREMVAQAAESEIDAYILKPLTVKAFGDKITWLVDSVNNPPPMIAHLKKARACKESGDVENALKELKAAMKADPNSSRPLRDIGLHYLERKNLEAAEKYLLKAAGMNRYDVFAFHNLGELYLIKNDIDLAAKFFEKAMQVSPRHVTRGIYFAKALIKKGIYEKAEKTFDKALSLSNYDSVLMEDVADYCMKNKVHEYAIRTFEAILRKHPERTDIMMKLGITLTKAGKPKEALIYFFKIEKREPDNLALKFHMAHCFIDINQMYRAEKALRDILEIDPDNVNAREILKSFI